jgi:hypothetical protein
MSFQDANISGLEGRLRYNLTAMEEGLVKEILGYEGAVGVRNILETFKEYQQ